MRTMEEIRQLGLEALREKLGQAGMIKFLSQFDNGSGDYVKDRHQWVDQKSLEDIRNISKDTKKES